MIGIFRGHTAMLSIPMRQIVTDGNKAQDSMTQQMVEATFQQGVRPVSYLRIEALKVWDNRQPRLLVDASLGI